MKLKSIFCVDRLSLSTFGAIFEVSVGGIPGLGRIRYVILKVEELIFFSTRPSTRPMILNTVHPGLVEVYFSARRSQKEIFQLRK